MSAYTVAHLDEIDEITDGREPWRPIRHHLGITSFGINAWTGREAGDRIINEHDEADLDDGAMWPTSFALKELTGAEEARIGALVKKAVRGS